MVALSLVSLCIFIFGAYAYGVTTVLALRQTPVWGGENATDVARRPGLNPAVLTLCAVCTVWFVLHGASELQVLTGRERWQGLPAIIALVLSYTFPPLIMHNVLHEGHAEMGAVWRRRWARPIWVMYAVCLTTGAYVLGVAMFDLPRPRPFGVYAGVSVGLLFTICSVYCIALMTRRRLSTPVTARQSADQRGLHRTMIGLFVTMIPLFFALLFLRERGLMAEALDRLTRALPIFFLVTSIYFENRFEFYDLIVKRATTLLASLLTIGVFFAASLSTLERLPGGIARPWLFAVAMLPMALVLPWLHKTVGRWLDRMWFGREFTPVEAVKHVLSAMQPATDERALVEVTEARLSDMFHTDVHILLDNALAPAGAVVETIDTGPSKSDRAPLRVAVVRCAGSRPLLSEDVSLLRSLASVFGYMLENVRLQQRRQEQDLIAQRLRLQTSRSELKALRAQINPHFLFNALNAIASLIHTDPTRADATVEQLAEVFRYTLRRSEQEWAPLDQELAFARAYLDVEQARFGKRLSFSIDAAPQAAAAQVPAMLLHTLVENAVKHGISQVRGAGRIEILAAAEDDVLLLEVTDTGPGWQESSEGRGEESFGLRSVRDRLRGYFAARASLELMRDNVRGLTVVRVRMPLVSEVTREASFVKEPV
jgi:signal transduction histidine kinase